MEKVKEELFVELKKSVLLLLFNRPCFKDSESQYMQVEKCN